MKRYWSAIFNIEFYLKKYQIFEENSGLRFESFRFFPTFTENDRFKTKSRTLRMMKENLDCLLLILSKMTYFGGRLMVLNVQITMTNVKRWSCLIYDC